MNARRGLTVLETVVALGLLACLIVFLGGLFVQLIGTSNKAGDSTVGLQLAQSLLDETVRAGQFPPAVGPQSRLLYAHDAAVAQEFMYQVTSSATQVTPGKAPIYYVDVQVWWNGPAGQARHGQGRLEARLGRLVTP